VIAGLVPATHQHRSRGRNRCAAAAETAARRSWMAGTSRAMTGFADIRILPAE
jgi:hypothetical protein